MNQEFWFSSIFD